MYRITNVEELIEAQESLQEYGYTLADYDEYKGTETWRRGETEIVIQFVENGEE